MTNIEKMKEMLEMQELLNSSLHPEWKTQPWSMQEAMMVEVAELLTEMGYKWWKAQTIDYDKVRSELVDIWHFILNINLVNGTEKALLDDLEMNISRSMFENEIGGYTDAQTREMTMQWLIQGINYNDFSIQTFFSICLNYGMQFDDIYWVYMFKNILNKFRWANGYKEGTYVKEWDGIEDNNILMGIYRANETMSFTELYKKLEWHYKTKVLDKLN